MDPALLAVLGRLVAGQEPWPLFLYGPPGTGKTSAVLAFADLVDASVYKTAGDLTDEYHAQVTGRGPAVPWERFRGGLIAGAVRLFVLDELGTRKTVSDSHYAVVHRVLDLREGFPLIVVSNLSAAELAHLYDARIADRLLAGTQFLTTGESQRV